eukprot:CAMPEP_0172561936 /NCGR_PEP_ID=MMETSP1067-20121228/94877_1 /TAXON_ID=265564 ORGANISM="Thalassiosira punctigera, Strain Tpunct2005C2" /NCGR_SAMPLE_ID=MMETSP1067 /ASSEMBLY_ACC=CAM_ASM_000444 /LENGTH=257 /DNA_ID=CAMNT_0013352071 /DNA_START=55 /DNA_END=828 /DNA_ORIENTATION=+
MLSANVGFLSQLPASPLSQHGHAKHRPNIRKHRNKKRVHYTASAARRHKYEFDWELEREYWYSRPELRSMSTVRLDEAKILREAKGIEDESRDDADELTNSSRDVFIGYKLTHALDDTDDNHEISIRGIEHFVYPVLQKEMIRRKKELRGAVLGYSRDPKTRKMDPKGIRLAKESAEHSQWARDVAKERGIKYCEMKRGGGRGGGLLQATKMTKARRKFSLCEQMKNETRRGSLMGALEKDDLLSIDAIERGLRETI